MELMKSHISFNRGITREELFYQIFKATYNDELPKHWLLWELCKRAMHKLRRDSNCFVMSALDERYVYFVASNREDAELYIGKLDNTISRMRSMQKRVMKSVDEKWCREKWDINYEKKKKINKN